MKTNFRSPVEVRAWGPVRESIEMDMVNWDTQVLPGEVVTFTSCPNQRIALKNLMLDPEVADSLLVQSIQAEREELLSAPQSGHLFSFKKGQVPPLTRFPWSEVPVNGHIDVLLRNAGTETVTVRPRLWVECLERDGKPW